MMRYGHFECSMWLFIAYFLRKAVFLAALDCLSYTCCLVMFLFAKLVM